MHVNADISDLFFNTDVSHAVVNDKDGQFVDWNHDALREEAETFLASLDRLGVAVPTADELIQDFHNRV
jgi:hypothetical protein